MAYHDMMYANCTARTRIDGDPAVLIAENQMLREEIRVSREAAEITAHLVVEQF